MLLMIHSRRISWDGLPRRDGFKKVDAAKQATTDPNIRPPAEYDREVVPRQYHFLGWEAQAMEIERDSEVRLDPGLVGM